MIFGCKKQLVNAEIRGFEPLTDNDKTIERKNELLNKIEEQIDLDKAKKDCEGKLFSLKIIYYLNNNTRIRGKYEKDLENMTKIVADSLTDYLIDQDRQSDKKTGLGLMRDDKDIHELHLTKKFVGSDSEQGLDITLYKFGDKKQSENS